MMGKRWVALLTAAALITLTGFSLQGEAAPQADTLTANGSATVETTPDVVRLTLGIQEEGATPSAIWQTGWERFAAVRQALLDAGIAEEDLSGGTDLYLGQNYNDNGYPDGYRFRAVLEVTIRDAENAGSYIDTAIAAGADVRSAMRPPSTAKPWAGRCRTHAPAPNGWQPPAAGRWAGCWPFGIQTVSPSMRSAQTRTPAAGP